MLSLRTGKRGPETDLTRTHVLSLQVVSGLSCTRATATDKAALLRTAHAAVWRHRTAPPLPDSSAHYSILFPPPTLPPLHPPNPSLSPAGQPALTGTSLPPFPFSVHSGAYGTTFPATFHRPVRPDGTADMVMLFSCGNGFSGCEYKLNYINVTLQLSAEAAALAMARP